MPWDCRCVACLFSRPPPPHRGRCYVSYHIQIGWGRVLRRGRVYVWRGPVALPQPKDTRTRLGCTRARRPTGGSAGRPCRPLANRSTTPQTPTASDPLRPPRPRSPDDDGLIIIQTMHPPQLIPNPNRNNKHTNRHTPEPRRTSRPGALGAPEAAAGPLPRPRRPPPPPLTRP